MNKIITSLLVAASLGLVASTAIVPANAAMIGRAILAADQGRGAVR